MTDVAVCGLGLMGAPVAARLAAAGHRVTGWDRSPGRAATLASGAVTVAGTPAEAASGAQLAIVLVNDADAARSVILGPDGVAAGRPRVIAQMSTIAPQETLALAGDLPPHVGFLDAPVTGSVPQAGSGQLRVLLGGDEATCAAVTPVLGVLGTLVRCGPVGSASALKCVLNACVAPMIALLAEGLVLGDRLGLDQELLLDELQHSRLGPLVARKRAMITQDEFPADSRLTLFAKDMQVAQAAAAGCGTQLRLAGEAALLANEAVAAGLGDQDYAVLTSYLRGRRQPAELSAPRPPAPVRRSGPDGSEPG